MYSQGEKETGQKDDDNSIKRAKWSADTFSTYMDEEYVTGKGTPLTDYSKFYKKVETPLDFIVELSSTQRVSGQREDEPDLSIDERLTVASVKTITNRIAQAASALGVSVGVATVASAPGIATAAGIAAGATIGIAFVFPAAVVAGAGTVITGASLIIGSPLVALKYEEWIVKPIMDFEFKPIIDDRSDEEKTKARQDKFSSMDLSILRGYQKLKEEYKGFSLNADLPVYLKDDSGELHLTGVLKRSSSNKLRFFTDENIKKSMGKASLEFSSDLFFEKKLSTPFEKTVKEFKKEISGASQKKTKPLEQESQDLDDDDEEEFIILDDEYEFELLESILFESSDPKAVKSSLSEKEIEYLNQMYDRTTKNYSEDVSKKVEKFVNNVNNIVDRKAFEESYKRKLNGEQNPNDMLPIMHTLFNVFSFIEPEKAMVVQGTLHHSGQLLSGGVKILELLANQGLSALTSAGFSLATGDFLAGLSGLIGLFGEKSDPNQAIFSMLQGISQQITRLHEDMLENFRQMSIALGLVDWHVVKGFEKLETLSKQQHQEAKIMLAGIEKVLYINTIYLEEIKKALDRLEGYQFFQQISDADWRPVIEEVKNSCALARLGKKDTDSGHTEMAFETLSQGIEKLYTALKKVRQNSITRANNINLSELDYGRLAILLGVVNSNIASDPPKTLAENYKLGTEQNIHLLTKYLRHLPLNKEFPENEKLYNPGVLFDIAKTTHELMNTYRKAFGYLGLPQNPVTETLKSLVDGVNGFENFMNTLSTTEVVEYLLNDYTDELQKFSGYIRDYQDSGALKYFVKNVKPKLMNHMDNDLQALKNLDASMTSDFFTMSGRNPDGHGWFEFLWSHWWSAVNRWSPGTWNEPSCHKKGNRPCWVPTSEIEKAKQIYKNGHQVRAQNIYNQVVDYQAGKKSILEQDFKIGMPIEKISDFIFYGSQNVNYWQSVPYYFRSGIPCTNPLLVPNWYLDKVPNAIFNALNLGYGELKTSQWTTGPDGYLHFSLSWKYSENNLSKEFVLFAHRTANVLSGYKAGEPLSRESFHYTWFGGNLPTGTCQEFDPDLNRVSTCWDSQAYSDYSAGNAVYDCPAPRCHGPGYRATICMPDTMATVGIFPDAASYQKSPQSTIDILNQWPATTKVSDAELSEIEGLVRKKQRKIRIEIMSELRTYLASGTAQSTRESEMPEHLQKDLVLSFNRLSVKARVLKMVLSLLVTPYELHRDPSWPNIFDGNDILRELNQYQGQAVYLDSFLEKNRQALLAIKPQLLKNIRGRKIEYYPFLHIKQWFENYILEVSSEILPNIISASKPENMYQLEKFVHMLPAMEQMLPGTFNTMLRINPGLAKFAMNLEPSLENFLLTDGEDDPSKQKGNTHLKCDKTREICEGEVSFDLEDQYNTGNTGRKLFSLNNDFANTVQTSSADRAVPPFKFITEPLLKVATGFRSLGEKFYSSEPESTQTMKFEPRMLSEINAQIPLVQWTLHYAMKWLPSNQVKDLTLTEETLLNQRLIEVQQLNKSLQHFRIGIIGTCSLFDDKLDWLNAKSATLKKDMWRCIRQGKFTDNQLLEFNQRLEKIQSVVTQLFKHEAMLADWEKEAKQLNEEGKVISISYNSFYETLSHKIDPIQIDSKDDASLEREVFLKRLAAANDAWQSGSQEKVHSHDPKSLIFSCNNSSDTACSNTSYGIKANVLQRK